MFWLITAVVLLPYANAVKIAVKYYAFLPTSVLIKAGAVILLFPLTWTAYYRLHRRFKRLSQEGQLPNQRLMKEVQALSIAFVVSAYMLLGFCFSIVGGLLACIAKAR